MPFKSKKMREHGCPRKTCKRREQWKLEEPSSSPMEQSRNQMMMMISPKLMLFVTRRIREKKTKKTRKKRPPKELRLKKNLPKQRNQPKRLLRKRQRPQLSRNPNLTMQLKTGMLVLSTTSLAKLRIKMLVLQSQPQVKMWLSSKTKLSRRLQKVAMHPMSK